MSRKPYNPALYDLLADLLWQELTLCYLMLHRAGPELEFRLGQSQGSSAWKEALQVIWSYLLHRAELMSKFYNFAQELTGLVKFWKSLKMELPQPLWASVLMLTTLMVKFFSLAGACDHCTSEENLFLPFSCGRLQLVFSLSLAFSKLKNHCSLTLSPCTASP